MEFKEVDDAKKAIDEMNGKEFHGRTLTVELSKRSKPYNPTPGVCMSNYSYKSNFTFKHIIYSISVSYTYIHIY